MNIYCIIVTYNGLRWSDRCFNSLQSSSLPVTTIVIDNASTDGTPDYIEAHFPNVDVIKSTENLGFAKANNIGIRKAYEAGADYVMLLNQDAWIEPKTIEELVKTFEENENVGIASPIHLNGSYSGLDFKFHNCMSGDFVSDLYMQRVKPYYESPFVNAAAWLMSRQCIETVGGFDTLLFRHYGEDVNYGQRLHYHQLRFVINTRCTICHDREDRKGKDHKFGDILVKEATLFRRMELGDINTTPCPSIARSITLLKRKKILKTLRGRFKAIPVINEEIRFLEKVEDSRTANMKRGLTWL